ncbi:class II aldolase/adducin family protein [Brachybacterium halotolerans]
MTAALDAVISAGRSFVSLGMSPGSSGNVSIREGDRVLVSATGTDLGRLSPDSFAVLDLDGRQVAGPRASKEAPLHTAFYRRRGDAGAVIHLHSAYATAVSVLAPWSDRTAVPPLTPYAVMRVGRVPMVPYRMPGSPELGELLEGLSGDFRAALLAHHGMVVAGRDAAHAQEVAVELEEACRLTVLTRGLDPVTLTDDHVAELVAAYGVPWE